MARPRPRNNGGNVNVTNPFSKFQRNQGNRRRSRQPTTTGREQQQQQRQRRPSTDVTMIHEQEKERRVLSSRRRMDPQRGMDEESFVTHDPLPNNGYAASPSSLASQQQQQQHAFLIDSNSILTPRADAWLFLFLSSCASTSSLAVASPASYRSVSEQVALATMGISTVISLCVAVAFRYRPSRDGLTISLNGNFGNFTGELFLSTVSLLLWLVSMGLVFGEESYMAVARTEIWNTNLYFATWISFGLSSYLVTDLITADDASGLLPKECSLVMGNAISRGWALLFIGAVGLLAFSLFLSSGTVCAGMLGETNSCKMASVGIVCGILGMILAGAYVAISLLDRKDDNFRGRQDPRMPIKPKPASKKNLISSILSGMSLLGYSINAAFVTSPTQNLSSEPCNVYFSSWICFALSLYLCIRHAEVYLVPGSTRDVRTLVMAREAKATTSTTTKSRRMRRSESKTSHSTAPQSDDHYSSEEEERYNSEDDDDEEDEEQDDLEEERDADDALTQMVDSQSEDGPMVFLPAEGDVSASDMDDDSSYQSMTRGRYLMPNAYGQPSPHQQQQQQGGLQPPQMQHSSNQVAGGGSGNSKQGGSQRSNRREPHKPRSVSPSGDYQRTKSTRNTSGTAAAKSSIASARSGMDASPANRSRRSRSTSADPDVGANTSRPQAEPPGFSSEEDEDHNPLHGHGHGDEPSANNDRRSRATPDPLGSSFVGGIDTRVQSRISTSSSSGGVTRGSEAPMTTTRGDSSRPLRRSLSKSRASSSDRSCVTNPGVGSSGNLGKSQTSSGLASGLKSRTSSSNRSCVTNPGLVEDDIGQNNNMGGGYPVETVYSDGPSEDQSSSAPSMNPLDRTTRPPPRPLPGQQQQQQHQVHRGRDPSFRASSFTQHQAQLHHLQQQLQQQARQPTPPHRRETLTSDGLNFHTQMAMQQMAMQDMGELSSEQTSRTSVALTTDGNSGSTRNTSDTRNTSNKSETKSSGDKSSKKSRSNSSRKKRRSKSREGSDTKKKSGDNSGSQSKHSSKAPSRTTLSQHRQQQTSVRSGRSGGRSAHTGSRGPPTISHDSSGPAGQGPPTVSASGESAESDPVTDDEPMEMGRVGPRSNMKMPPEPTQAHGILMGGIGDRQSYLQSPGMGMGAHDDRPLYTINGSPDNMSMMSEPTMEGFEPPADDIDMSQRVGPRGGGGNLKSSKPPVTGQDGMRYSHADLSAASSQTNENKVLRQGAVDMMVMEALRQAQEARQNSQHSSGLPASMAPGAATQQPAQRSRDSSRQSGQNKSTHGRNPSLSFHKQKTKRSSKSGSGSGGRKGGSGHAPGSIHSFYSESEATSFDAGDAFAC